MNYYAVVLSLMDSVCVCVCVVVCLYAMHVFMLGCCVGGDVIMFGCTVCVV